MAAQTKARTKKKTTSINGNTAPPIKVVKWPIDKPQPYEQNPRLITDSAVEKVANSLQAYGWQQPIVVDKDGIILAGHTRLAAAKSLKMKFVPVAVADLPPEKARAYRLADNRTHEEASWLNSLLSDELQALDSLDFDMGLTGFDEGEFLNIINGTDDAADDKFNPEDEWQGMPDFDQNDLDAYRSIKVHFRDETAVEEFKNLMHQKFSDKAKFIWHPKAELADTKDLAYVEDEA